MSVNISDYKIKPYLCIVWFLLLFLLFLHLLFFLLIPQPPTFLIFFFFDELCVLDLCLSMLCPNYKNKKKKENLSLLDQRLKEIKSLQLILTTIRAFVHKGGVHMGK